MVKNRSDRERKAMFANMGSGHKPGTSSNQQVIRSSPVIQSRKIVVRGNGKFVGSKSFSIIGNKPLISKNPFGSSHNTGHTDNKKKLPKRLSKLFDTPEKRKKAEKIMKEGRDIADLQSKKPKSHNTGHTDNNKETITISKVRMINKDKGKFFFTKSSMKFFDSRIETKGNLIQNRFFVTSEQFVSSDGVKSDRKFTIRDFNKKTGTVGTVGEFNNISTKAQAVKIAREIV